MQQALVYLLHNFQSKILMHMCALKQFNKPLFFFGIVASICTHAEIQCLPYLLLFRLTVVDLDLKGSPLTSPSVSLKWNFDN